MSRRLHSGALLAAALLAAGIGAALAWACGPFFPNRLLMNGDSAVLWAPVADFRIEIERLRPPGTPVFHALLPPDEQDEAQQTAAVDGDDLRAALEKTSLPAAQRARLLEEYRNVRNVLLVHAMQRQQLQDDGWERKGAPPELPPVSVPADLPSEFAEYLRGAIAYYGGELDTARAAWQAVLALPAAERRYRSTWAAFMLGKSWLDGEPENAVEYFGQVRALAQDGFVDSLGLASSSLGWEARAELQRGQFERAVELYLQQMATEDSTAIWSLRIVAARILKEGDDVLRRAAGDDNTRRVVTAYLLARGGPRQSVDEALPASLMQRWLEVVEATGAKDPAGAEHLAWAAYQAGSFAAADRWLKLAPEPSGIGHWIRAKLLLRGGKVHQAAAELALATRGFPPDEPWDNLNTDFADSNEVSRLWPGGRALGELGVLRLARRQYVEALDALLRAHYWLDAAYVAERVLTVNELAQYVEKSWPAASAEVEEATLPRSDGLEYRPGEDDQTYRRRADEWEVAELRRAELRKHGETNVRIRHLLARRLARAERWSEARTYLPRRLRARFDVYVRKLRLGRDRSQPKAERAQALWKAARISRYDGLELVGTELEPDWYAAYDGDFELPTVGEVRSHGGKEELTASTADERERVKGSAVAPSKRWHYRYLAADLAWQAAELMPDEADETARVLCEAGSWLKARGPQAAQRFYKALVRRCGKTELGREAQRLRWFPRWPQRRENE